MKSDFCLRLFHSQSKRATDSDLNSIYAVKMFFCTISKEMREKQTIFKWELNCGFGKIFMSFLLSWLKFVMFYAEKINCGLLLRLSLKTFIHWVGDLNSTEEWKKNKIVREFRHAYWSLVRCFDFDLMWRNWTKLIWICTSLVMLTSPRSEFTGGSEWPLNLLK